MNLQNISNVELISRMEKLVRSERKITHLILTHINEIEQRKIYAELGYSNMYAYLTKGLGYSNGSAFRRLESARLLSEVPEAAVKLENGSLNLTQLTDVRRGLKYQQEQSGFVVPPEMKFEILEKIENKNSFETAEVLSKEFNIPVLLLENIRPQKDNSIRLEITLSAEQFAELELAKNLLSHVCPSAQWSEVIAELAKKFNDKKLQRSKKEKSKDEDIEFKGNIIEAETENNAETENDESKMGEANTIESNKGDSMTRHDLAAKYRERIKRKKDSQRGREYISVEVKRFLLRRAEGCCEYINPLTHKKCSSKYQTQIEHIRPWALGGSNNIDNLKILCRTHNLLNARNSGLIR